MRSHLYSNVHTTGIHQGESSVRGGHGGGGSETRGNQDGKEQCEETHTFQRPPPPSTHSCTEYRAHPSD